MHIFVDSISKIGLSNNNLRVTLMQNGQGNQQIEVGTLIIPANMAAGFVNAMAGGIKKLDEQIKARQETQGDAGDAKMELQ